MIKSDMLLKFYAETFKKDSTLCSLLYLRMRGIDIDSGESYNHSVFCIENLDLIDAFHFCLRSVFYKNLERRERLG